MNIRIKQLVFGFCVAFVVLGASTGGACAEDVTYRGVVTGFPDFGGAVGTGGVNVRIDEILSDPAGNLKIGDAVTATWLIVPPFADISVAVGDSVEVCGEYRDIKEMPEHWSDVEEHWTDLSISEHYLVGLDVRFSGTAIEYIEATMPGAPSGWVVQVDEVFSGLQLCKDQLNVTTAAVAPPVGYMDPDIVEGDQVYVYGRYTHQDGCDVSLIGSDDYYLVGLDVRFSGTAIEYIEATMPGAPWGWVVQVDEVLNGPQPCNGQLNVTTASVAPPWGYMDPDITKGDQVYVYGRYTSPDGCDVSLIGSDEYYIKRSSPCNPGNGDSEIIAPDALKILQIVAGNI